MRFASWGIACFEYCFQVPAKPHRVVRTHAGTVEDDSGDLTLSIFPVSSVLLLGDRFKWNYGVGFAFIVAAAFFIFHKW